MDQPASDNRPPAALSRRQALRLFGGAAATAALAACGGATPTTAPGGAASIAPGGTATAGAAPTAATAARPAGSAVASAPAGGTASAIRIPASGARLPTERVNFRWIDSGDLKALFYRKYFAAYQGAHPNITVQYDPLPFTEIQKIVPLGVQNGNAHDVFQLPPNVPPGQAVREGWAVPIDDIVPNFQQWKANFPFGSFVDGVHVFDGKAYTFPLTSNKRYDTLTFYNTELLGRAGYDPGTKPLTWGEYRAAAKKVTEQGKGQYFGVIFGAKSPARLAAFVRNLARMAGTPAGSGDISVNDIDFRTGQYAYTSAGYLAAIDLLLALNADGSVFPGSLSLGEVEARSRMPQGVAGIILEGPWNIPQWPRENANFQFGVASQPVPDSGTPLPLTFFETGANQVFVYAKSPNKAIAGDMFSYIGSEEGQTQVVIASEGNLRALFPRANDLAQESRQLDLKASAALKLFQEQIRTGPAPVIRNPDAGQVASELKALKPDFGEVLQGLFSGQLKDPKAAMKDLQDRAGAELERAIKATVAKGAKVSRDDWKFANFDPTKDYTQADYEALKR